jgi:hypothetical protein
MVPPTPSPSARLVRAAAAERAELRRHRERLVAMREALRADLAAADAALAELDERDALLDRVAGPLAPVPSAPATGREPHEHAAPPAAPRAPAAAAREPAAAPRAPAAGAREPAGAPPAPRSTADTVTVLRGPAIRHAAIRVLLDLPDRPHALHYRAWFDALRAAGFAVAGKDPLAVFLTQLGRSPVVRKGTQSGVYELDPEAPARLRTRLEALHTELRGLTSTPAATADLTAIRARRAALTTQIGHVEKALEEAVTVLPPADVAAAG